MFDNWKCVISNEKNPNKRRRKKQRVVSKRADVVKELCSLLKANYDDSHKHNVRKALLEAKKDKKQSP